MSYHRVSLIYYSTLFVAVKSAENGILSNKTSNLLPYPREFKVWAEETPVHIVKWGPCKEDHAISIHLYGSYTYTEGTAEQSFVPP